MLGTSLAKRFKRHYIIKFKHYTSWHVCRTYHIREICVCSWIRISRMS